MCSLSLSLSLFLFIYIYSVYLCWFPRGPSRPRGDSWNTGRGIKSRGGRRFEKLRWCQERKRETSLSLRTLTGRYEKETINEDWDDDEPAPSSNYCMLLYPLMGTQRRRRRRRGGGGERNPGELWDGIKKYRETMIALPMPSKSIRVISRGLSLWFTFSFGFFSLRGGGGGWSFTDCMRPEAHQGIYYRV